MESLFEDEGLCNCILKFLKRSDIINLKSTSKFLDSNIHLQERIKILDSSSCARKLLMLTRHILRHVWNPLASIGQSLPIDEYDSYLPFVLYACFREQPIDKALIAAEIVGWEGYTAFGNFKDAKTAIESLQWHSRVYFSNAYVLTQLGLKAYSTRAHSGNRSYRPMIELAGVCFTEAYTLDPTMKMNLVVFVRDNGTTIWDLGGFNFSAAENWATISIIARELGRDVPEENQSSFDLFLYLNDNNSSVQINERVERFREGIMRYLAVRMRSVDLRQAFQDVEFSETLQVGPMSRTHMLRIFKLCMGNPPEAFGIADLTEAWRKAFGTPQDFEIPL